MVSYPRVLFSTKKKKKKVKFVEPASVIAPSLFPGPSRQIKGIKHLVMSFCACTFSLRGGLHQCLSAQSQDALVERQQAEQLQAGLQSKVRAHQQGAPWT